MFTHLPTGRMFSNRKEAKLTMGHAAYNKAVKNNEFTRHCNEEETKQQTTK